MKHNVLTYIIASIRVFAGFPFRNPRGVSLLCALMVLAMSQIALYAKDLTKHYIVAFDLSVGNYKPVYSSPATLNALSRILAENGFNRKTDHLSIVGYSMPLGNPSTEEFVRPFTDGKGNPIIWHSIPEGSITDFLPNWPQGQPILSPAGGPYGSMQSLAKPHIVMEARTDDDSTFSADKTIMLVVSDDVVNGTDDDYQREWNHVSVTPGANTAKFRNLSKGVFDTMKDFNEEFKFVQTPIVYKGKDHDRVPLSADNNYKITPYEVVAAEKPSIHSVTDMPSPLPLKRVRGGYKLNMETQAINPKYRISTIDISAANGNVLGQSKDGIFDFVIPSSAISEGDTLLVAMKLLLKDGFYNGSVVSADNDRYRSGMMVKQVVKLQDEAKVLGLFPLKDIFWWWFPNDIFTAVLFWDFILVLVFVLIILILVKKLSAYAPLSEKIILRPVESRK